MAFREAGWGRFVCFEAQFLRFHSDQGANVRNRCFVDTMHPMQGGSTLHAFQRSFPTRFIEDWRNRRRSGNRGYASPGMRRTKKKAASTVTATTSCSTLNDIDHAVIFIQPNHSFAHSSS